MNSLIYNSSDIDDVINVLQFINDFTVTLGLQNVVIDANKIQAIIKSSKIDFPHKDGLEKASTFKKIAHFVCYFVSERPIAEAFSEDTVGVKMVKIENHQNAIIALELAIAALENSTVLKRNSDTEETTPFVITEPIKLSRHSYLDIVDALASSTPSTSYKLVTVLLEQIVYKSNPGCQYNP